MPDDSHMTLPTPTAYFTAAFGFWRGAAFRKIPPSLLPRGHRFMLTSIPKRLFFCAGETEELDPFEHAGRCPSRNLCETTRADSVRERRR